MTKLLIILLCSFPMLAAGQASDELESRYGHIVAKRELKGDSNVLKGVIIGGLVGLATAGGKSGSTKAKRTAGGAVAGGVIANEVDKSKRQWLYTVRIEGEEDIRIAVPDDRLQLGDCAGVHFGVEQTELRYASDYFCRPKPRQRPVVVTHPPTAPVAQPAADPETASDPSAPFRDPCLEAKRRLLDEQDEDEVARLIDKVRVICEH